MGVCLLSVKTPILRPTERACITTRTSFLFWTTDSPPPPCQRRYRTPFAHSCIVRIHPGECAGSFRRRSAPLDTPCPPSEASQQPIRWPSSAVGGVYPPACGRLGVVPRRLHALLRSSACKVAELLWSHLRVNTRFRSMALSSFV